MATVKNNTQSLTEQVSNVNRNKVLTFVGKVKEKRLASFAGLVAKLQQSSGNGEEQFVYFANKKIVAFLTLLRESGVIHNFHLIQKTAQ